jgi:hypothetical protein
MTIFRLGIADSSETNHLRIEQPRLRVECSQPMTVQEIQKKLESLGVPPDRSLLVATQLDKRAAQFVEQKKMTREAAEQYLIGLMAQGWAAQKSGGGQP